MKRKFQHNEGEIGLFLNLTFSTVKALINADDKSIIVLWLKDRDASRWFRLFCDGVYCGIDQYSSDRSFDDMDDAILIVDHSAWFQHKKIIAAFVNSDNNKSPCIKISLKFDQSLCQLIYQCQSEQCDLVFIDQ
ncbi:MAG: hypothetical protein KAQ72_15275 [Desulfobacula sp.]|nr:hypothetical protein [Desulfobacula sp.]